jgi:hypothetical protein
MHATAEPVAGKESAAMIAAFFEQIPALAVTVQAVSAQYRKPV